MIRFYVFLTGVLIFFRCIKKFKKNLLFELRYSILLIKNSKGAVGSINAHSAFFIIEQRKFAQNCIKKSKKQQRRCGLFGSRRLFFLLKLTFLHFNIYQSFSKEGVMPEQSVGDTILNAADGAAEVVGAAASLPIEPEIMADLTGVGGMLSKMSMDSTYVVDVLLTSYTDDMLLPLWMLVGAALVFFMQAGFAMLEAGFTRAKNAGNIIMKNLMDLGLGATSFMLIGYSILTGEKILAGFFGLPSFGIFTEYSAFDYRDFFFNLVFCATAATIVSGAMAERTKFAAYCIYSIVISAIIYPIEAGWVWGGGWLSALGTENGWLAGMQGPGFLDFAGSAAIHMVGGIAGFVGAWFLGPRIGKYAKDGKVRAIPGHSITLGALGVFILWFGWYGFNGAAAESVTALGSIFVTTTIAAISATVSAMALTWFKNGKPDVSMGLNAALAGLVGITAGCAFVDAVGALVIGLVAGIIVVLAIEFIDIVLKVDDPVGAVAVHGVAGAWGAVAVGLFAVNDGGLFYGGGANLLIVQTIGTLSIAVWTFATTGLLFYIIKAANGLRVPKEDEIAGLDISEHGLAAAYADFMISNHGDPDEKPAAGGSAPAAVPADVAIPVVDNSKPGAKMTKVVIVTKQSRFEALKSALDQIGITGMTVSQVLGCGMQKGRTEYYRGVPLETKLLPKVKVEIVICKVPLTQLVDAVKRALYTGNIGDGKMFIYDVENVIKVRTGEQGYDALQDK
jgi:Amt family ammonium transporter